jgi:hypothetical protein
MLLQQHVSPVTAPSTGDLSGLHLPADHVFQDSWVRANIAVTYAHQVQDGIGSQALRMLAVYGLASSLGIGHVFRPLGCVGHIGSHVHYREAGCNFINEADRRQLNKAQRMIDLPTTAVGNTSHWHTKFLPALDWTPFVRDVTDAKKQQRPTLFEVERVNQLVRYHPDIFLSIPALRPASPPVSCPAATACPCSRSHIAARFRVSCKQHELQQTHRSRTLHQLQAAQQHEGRDGHCKCGTAQLK